jgi:hypothetical protein
MKKISFPRPIPVPLYYLKHPALRQVGCPVCHSHNVAIDLGNTAVVKGPVKHPTLGPILGEVFSVVCHCAMEHSFVLRLANHRNTSLVWTDVAIVATLPDSMDAIKNVTIDPPVAAQQAFDLSAGGNVVTDHMDKLEKTGILGDEDKALYDAMQKHQPPAKPIDEIPGNSLDDDLYHEAKEPDEMDHEPEEGKCAECEDTECNNNPNNPTNLTNTFPGESPNTDYCHAGLSVTDSLYDIKEFGGVQDTCICCPNVVCPVNMKVQKMLRTRKYNLDSCNGEIVTKPIEPHDRFFEELQEIHEERLDHYEKALKSQSLNILPNVAKRLLANLAEVNKLSIPSFIKVYKLREQLVREEVGLRTVLCKILSMQPEDPMDAPASEASPQPNKKLANTKNVDNNAPKKALVPGCPEKLTVSQAKSDQCQKSFCKGCEKTSCPAHPDHKPKV